MKTAMLLALVVSASLAFAQSGPLGENSRSSNHEGSQVTMQGCLGRMNGDFVLTRQDPGVTYELEAGHGVQFASYLGEQVEISGAKSPSLSTSSDAGIGSPSSETVMVSSISVISRECTSQ